MFRIQQMYRLFGWRRTAVYAHWSTLAGLGGALLLAARGGVPLLVFAFAFLTIMLVHELGHATVAISRGYRAHYIELYPIHGRCIVDDALNLTDRAAIAWGGVTARLGLLLLGVMIWQFPGLDRVPIANVFLSTVTYVNATILVFNLVPAPGLDGRDAWSGLRTLLKRRRSRSRSPSIRRAK